MDLEAIYLVENLSTYNFQDTVFLAADIDAIVERLILPVIVKDVEKILFLAHVLKTTVDICRTIVRNYETLEELLKVNWSSTENGAEKLQFYEKLIADDPVKMISHRILLTKDGVRSLGIMQEFYRMHLSKDAFKAMLGNVLKAIPSTAASNAFNNLKASILHAETNSEPQTPIKNNSPIIDIVKLANVNNSPFFTKCIAEFQEKIVIPNNEDMLEKQVQAIKKLFSNSHLLQTYQEALKIEKFYDVNLMLLKLYHDRLLARNIYYDGYVVMLLYLLRCGCRHDTILRNEFLNESRIGSAERIRMLLLELQNFR